MKNWKTSVLGIIAGLPVAIQALLDAYNAGQFTGKSAFQVVTGIGIILIGLYAKDWNVTGTGTKPPTTP